MSDMQDHSAPRDRRVLTCDEAIRLLASYLDGELENDSRETVEDHLHRCRSCFSRHEFEKGLKAQLERLGREEVRPDFEERIRGLVARFAEPEDNEKIT
jgi:anti-sigma factor (TIGR02949 family)